TTAIELARRFGVTVNAVDISDMMLERTRRNVERARIGDLVRAQKGDIMKLPYADATFDRVVAEAVTMFVDGEQAARELFRVVKPGGLVLATEFLWRTPPSAAAREAFLGQLCPGMLFDTKDDWLRIYDAAGLRDIEIRTGPFEMMSLRGFLSDEGVR